MIHHQAIDLIKRFEGLELKAYRCPANVWTIGYGVTRLGDRSVRATDSLPSKEDAESLLVNQLEKEFLPKLEIIPAWSKLNSNQQSALISFAWSLGAHFYGSVGFETITKHLRGQQWKSVPEALLLYVKANGKTLEGLVNRRKAEATLWNTPMNIKSILNTDKLLSNLDSNSLKDVQTLLSQLGYYEATIDGLFGKHTAYAFTQWKSDNHMGLTDTIGAFSYGLLKEQASSQPSTSGVNWNDFSSKVSRYFTVGEVCQHDARRFPSSETIKRNILSLAQELDDVREKWGSGIKVISWYRPPAINRAVGGVRNSQHIIGLAADIAPVNGKGKDFEVWLDREWDRALGYGQRAGRGFTHLDMRAGRIRWNY